MKLSYNLQSLGAACVLHSAQLWYLLSKQQLLTLHQEAFSFPWHPGYFPFKNFLQAPQYKPQKAMFAVSVTMFSMIDSRLGFKGCYARILSSLGADLFV